jgi:hypothetical protein
MDIDDPLLVSFTDLDGLLKDSALFENLALTPPSSDVATDTFVFPLQYPGVPEPPLLDLSECLSLCSPSLSPSTDAPPVTPQTLCSSPNLSQPRSLPAETSVFHDHTYTTFKCTTTETPETARKRKASTDSRKRKASTDSLPLSPDTADSESPPGTKIAGDEKYLVRRQKNNVASQASRSKRRTKQRDLFSRVDELETANAALRERVREMEAEAEQLRKSLVQKLAS